MDSTECEKVEFALHVTSVLCSTRAPEHWTKLDGRCDRLASYWDGPLDYLKRIGKEIRGVFFVVSQTYRGFPRNNSHYPVGGDRGKDYWRVDIPFDQFTSTGLQDHRLQDADVLLFRISSNDARAAVTVAALLEGSPEHQALLTVDHKGEEKYGYEQLHKRRNRYLWFEEGEWRVRRADGKTPWIQLFVPGDVVLPESHVRWTRSNRMVQNDENGKFKPRDGPPPFVPASSESASKAAGSPKTVQHRTMFPSPARKLKIYQNTETKERRP